MTNLKEEILSEFDERIDKFLVTSTSKMVVKDFVKSAIDKAYKQGAKDMAEAVRMERKKKETRYSSKAAEEIKLESAVTFSSEGHCPNSYRYDGFNQAIDEMESRANQFLEKL